MDLRQLRYVVGVADSSNFTRAAEALHVAQPALSLGVRTLEQELGVRLFDRTSRRVTLTDAGAAFVAHARRILQDTDTLSEEMAEYAGAVRGHVRLSVWYHLDPDGARVLRRITRAYPDVEITIVELPTPVMLDSLRRGSIDIGLSLMASSLDLTDIESEIIRRERVSIAVAMDDPLARAASVTADELARQPLIAPLPGTAWRQLLDGLLAAHPRPRIAVETNEVSAAVAYAALGIGVAVMTRRVIEAVGQPVAIIPLEHSPEVVIAAAWSTGRYRSPAAEAVLSYALAEFRATSRERREMAAATASG